MPGYMFSIGPVGRRTAHAQLRTPGDYTKLSEVEQDRWDKATHAINRLLDLYLPDDEKLYGND